MCPVVHNRILLLNKVMHWVVGTLFYLYNNIFELSAITILIDGIDDVFVNKICPCDIN